MEKSISSLIFDGKSVETLNNKISKKVDPRLYLAAYYNPKCVSSDTSSEHTFWTAVTNIYALFTDCAGYIKDDFLNLLHKNNILNSSDKKRIQNFIQLIKCTRSLFCHNMSFELVETQKQLDKFNMFLKRRLQRESSVVSIPYKPELSSEDWDKLTSYLDSEFQSCLNILDGSINKIATRNEITKRNIVELWLKAIANWYERSLYFQTIANNYFKFKYCYLEQVINERDQNDVPYKIMRSNWIKEQNENWRRDKMKYMIEMKEPVFPDKILVKFFNAQL